MTFSDKILTSRKTLLTCCRILPAGNRRARITRLRAMRSDRSRSLSELATHKEEDPHDLHIEDGLPPLVVETLQQAGPGSDFASEQAAISEAVAAFREESELDRNLDRKADRAASSSAPHLLGKDIYAYSSNASSHKWLMCKI